MLKIKHRGKEKIKLGFEIIILKAHHLEKGLNGSTIFIQWRRGSKKKSGTTKRALVNSSECTWNEKITFTSTFFRDPRTRQCDTKLISFILKEDVRKKKNKTQSVGKVSVDLSKHLRENKGPIIVPLKKKRWNFS